MTPRLVLAACLASVGLCGPLEAQIRPQAGQGDPRLQFIEYQPEQVFLLEAAPGYQMMVELAPDEQIQSVAIGDSGGWQVSAARGGSRMFLKPLQAGAGTNMTVTTNVRVYAFDLVAVASPTPSVAYTVRFRYPAPASATPPAGVAAATPKNLYHLRGARALRPSGISDDGTRTYIEWAADAALPAVCLLDQAGRETLANGQMRDGLYVIDGVADHLVFRVDRKTARADRLPVGCK